MQKHSIISSFFALILIFSLPACKLFDDWDWKTDCELKQCETVSHSTGVCDPGFFNAYCKCEENYFWNWDTRDACVNPCDSKSCKIAHSTGECTSLSYDEYECGCEKGYFWNETELKCVSPCDPNPCGDTNLKECISESKEQFLCICENGYSFDGEKCAELPECSPESATPCKDSATWLAWSSKLSENQLNHCLNVSEGGMSDWQWPLIDQLRTLIQNCPNTEPGGECSLVWDSFPFFGYLENCESCEESDSGRYSKFGDKEELRSGTWISYNHSPLYNLVVNFGNAAIEEKENKDAVGIDSRCTRCLEGYFWFEGKCIYSPCNSDPCRDIPHAISECWPESATKYECDCEKGWFWDGSKCVDPCEGVSCDVPDSTGQCIGEKWNKYSCECEKKVWDYSNGRCITVCENNPCDAIPHANGCVPKNDTEYYCSCEDKYYWNGEECLSY